MIFLAGLLSPTEPRLWPKIEFSSVMVIFLVVHNSSLGWLEDSQWYMFIFFSYAFKSNDGT